jgi:hypothetical protein
MGIVDATTLILLQKMIADSYEHGRVVWKENRARCARTGEAESDDVRTHPYQSPIEMSANFHLRFQLPCGPNSAPKVRLSTH